MVFLLGLKASYHEKEMLTCSLSLLTGNLASMAQSALKYLEINQNKTSALGGFLTTC